MNLVQRSRNSKFGNNKNRSSNNKCGCSSRKSGKNTGNSSSSESKSKVMSLEADPGGTKVEGAMDRGRTIWAIEEKEGLTTARPASKRT